MTTFNIALTFSEAKALEYIAQSPEEWAASVVQERARIAGDEIIKIAVNKFLELGHSIPGNRDEIIRAAFDRGWVKTAAQRTAEAEAEA